MKNSYKNKMRALCLSIVLASAVSAVEKTDEQMNKKMGNQKEDEVGSATDSIKQKKLLVIGGKENQELDGYILLEAYNKRQLEADKKSGSVVMVSCESLKNVPKNKDTFHAIFSSEQYLDYTSEMKARISQKKDEDNIEANINFNTADLSKAETISWIESSNALFKNAQATAWIESRNAFFKNAQEVFSEKNRQLVDLLKKDGYLTLHLIEVPWILEVVFHPDVPQKINYYPSGQHCRVELINICRKDLLEFFAQKANSDRIREILKGSDLLPDVLAAFNKVESNPKGHNMTVEDVYFEIFLPLFQRGEYDKVMKNLGMERCDDEPIPYDKKWGWSLTYKKVGDPVTPDPTS